jgi:hypothetical protein
MEESGPSEEEAPAGEFGGALEEAPLRGGLSAKKAVFFLPKLKTLLWIVVAVMLLWGLLAADSMLLVAAVLLLVVVELEAIRRKLGR